MVAKLWNGLVQKPGWNFTDKIPEMDWNTIETFYDKPVCTRHGLGDGRYLMSIAVVRSEVLPIPEGALPYKDENGNIVVPCKTEDGIPMDCAYFEKVNRISLKRKLLELANSIED